MKALYTKNLLMHYPKPSLNNVWQSLFLPKWCLQRTYVNEKHNYINDINHKHKYIYNSMIFIYVYSLTHAENMLHFEKNSVQKAQNSLETNRPTKVNFNYIVIPFT